MLNKNTLVATTLICLMLGACGGKRYPIAVAWSAADGAAMSCEQLRAELAAGRDIERQIGEIASAGRTADGQRPKLYSMAKPDADRAVRARIEAVEAAMQAGRCSTAT